MYIYFLHFEVGVASGDCRVLIFARINNLPVQLGDNGTRRVNLQLLKSYKVDNGREELVSWL